MFIITVRGKSHIFNNSKEDDFLKFLPEHFKCMPSEMDVKLVEQRSLDAMAVLNLDMDDLETQKGVAYSIQIYSEQIMGSDEQGNPVVIGMTTPKPMIVRLEAGKVIPISEVSTQSLDGWPYAGDKNFIEMKFKP